MANSGVRGEEVMTDYQFKTLLKMVLAILKGEDSKEAAINEIEKLLDQQKD